MAELRRDPIGGRWVIVDTDHPSLPHEYECETHDEKESGCPFCYGNEYLTPHEIESFRDPSTTANTPGWQVRVVPNKFPALMIEGNLERRGLGIYDVSNGVGAHEVIIETPYHYKDISDLLNEEVEKIIFMAYRRSNDLMRDKRFKYVMIFKNYGPAAGASLAHPHTQIVALPMVPKSVSEELRGSGKYFEFRERCVFCDMMSQELQEKERIIAENAHFISFCPFVSRFPFEVWIMPKQHSSCFCSISADEIPSLAVMLKDVISKIKNIFGDIAYNYIIHSSPANCEVDNAGYHWHIEFMPKLTRVAGFEWGSGFYTVPTPPELAAKFLRQEIKKIEK